MNSMQLSQRLTRKRDSESNFAEALSDYERHKRAEEEFEPKKQLIIVRESIDQEIRELKAQYPKPSRSMRKMIDELFNAKRQSEKLQINGTRYQEP